MIFKPEGHITSNSKPYIKVKKRRYNRMTPMNGLTYYDAKGKKNVGVKNISE